MSTTCYKCKKTYSTKYRLKNHSCKADKIIKVFPCPDCGKVFKYKHHLTQHLNKAYRCVDKNKVDYRALYFDLKDKYDNLLLKINNSTQEINLQAQEVYEFEEEPEEKLEDLINIKFSIDINTKEPEFIIKIKETLNNKSFNRENSDDYFRDANNLLNEIQQNADDALIITRLDYYDDVVEIKNKYMEIINKISKTNYNIDSRYGDAFVFDIQRFASAVRKINKLLKIDY